MAADSTEAHTTPVTQVPHNEVERKDDLPETIIERIHAAAQEMPVIPKTGEGTTTNNKTGKTSTWSFLEDRVVTPEVRRVLIRNGLQALFCAVDHKREGKYQEKNTVKWHVQIWGVGLDEDPLVVPFISEGSDWTDKGISKADTSARKDFWRLQLMIGGGPENEQEDISAPINAPLTPDQKRRLKKLVEKAEELGYDVDILPMPETADACDDLLNHLENVTAKEFKTGNEIEEEDSDA